MEIPSLAAYTATVCGAAARARVDLAHETGSRFHGTHLIASLRRKSSPPAMRIPRVGNLEAGGAPSERHVVDALKAKRYALDCCEFASIDSSRYLGTEHGARQAYVWDFGFDGNIRCSDSLCDGCVCVAESSLPGDTSFGPSAALICSSRLVTRASTLVMALQRDPQFRPTCQYGLH